VDGAVIVQVECHSGVSYADRPVAVIYKEDRQFVARLISEERTPTGKRFHVILENKQEVELSYNESEDVWYATGLL
jgi:hypothetical protein